MAIETYSLVNILLLESYFHREWVLSLQDPNFANSTNLNVTNQRNPEHLSVIVELTYKAGVGDKIEINSNIKMVGLFTVPNNSPLPIEVFTNVNAPAIIFPFLREHLASISMKAGIQPIMLQPVNFVKNSEVEKNESENSK